MKKALLLALIFVVAASSSAFGEGGEIHQLWDIPTLTDSLTYTIDVAVKKYVEMKTTRTKDGDHYDVTVQTTDDIDLYDRPASILLFQKIKTLDDTLPYKAELHVAFSDVVGVNFSDTMFRGRDFIKPIFAGLIEKYGQPTSVMVKFRDFLYADRNGLGVETEIKELPNEFYSDNSISLYKIANSWKCPGEDVSYTVEAIFSNVKLVVDYDGWKVHTTVIFLNEVAEPMKPSYTKAPDPTKEPQYEDSGF